MSAKYLIALFFIINSFSVKSQTITGDIKDAKSNKALAYVNIGIKKKNIGTASQVNGIFSLNIPKEYSGDTLTFSLVGYQELNIPVSKITFENILHIQLNEKSIELAEVRISAEKLVEKKYGIKKRSPLVHFTDGMFPKNDIFEIGQLIKFGNTPSQITSANLYISEAREDSASFRINFYKYDGERPSVRIIEKSILQRHAIKEGWLRFDIEKYGIFLKGNFIVSIEFIPDTGTDIKPLVYEIKLGGSSKSFYRKNSLGQWNTPPHHYCLYITALVDKNARDEPEEEEAVPTFKIRSETVKDTFDIFVRLPKNYDRNSIQKHPVIYHLDGNAYFDHIGAAVRKLSINKSFTEPIIVGIGYRNAYVMDSLRNRDYTFPEASALDSFPVSGGGEKFYKFIKNELIPKIENTYKADPVSRTIMGHSLGGYFALFVLLKDLKNDPVFTNYAAASPSLSYQDQYIINEFKSLPLPENKNSKLFLSMGEMELSENSDSSFTYFNTILKKINLVEFQSKVYPNLEHMGTAVPSFEDGLKFILMKK